MPNKPGVPRPYWLELGTAKARGSSEIVWKRHPTTTFDTPESARRLAEQLTQQRWWVVSYRIMGPHGEVPTPDTDTDGSTTAAAPR
jgi:hypothetical protein